MSLRSQLTIAILIVVFLLTILLSSVGFLKLQHIEDSLAKSELNSQQVLWNKVVAIERDNMEEGSRSLTRDRATRKALKKNNKAKLSESAITTFNLLESSRILDRIKLLNKERVILFSAGIEEKQATLTSPLALSALKQGRVFGGLEQDADGKLVNSIAFPLLMRGKTIGVGVFSIGLDHALEDFKESDGSDVFVMKEGELLYGTDKQLFRGIFEKSNGFSDGVNHIDIGSMSFRVIRQSIVNIQGKNIGDLISVRDVTSESKASQKLNIVSVIVFVFAVFVSVAAVVFLLRHKLMPIRGVVRDLESIAEGKLSIEINNISSDEFGQLKAGLLKMVESLRPLITNIDVAANNLNESCGVINSLSHKADADLNQQKSSLSTISASMSEMSSGSHELEQFSSEAAETVNRCEVVSRKCSKYVNTADKTIQDLGGELSEAAELVNSLNDNVEGIGAIIASITGIAEQTNLLALNAAIEAARAGEQGRGFAVVADEVRALASRTQDATVEIQGMIGSLRDISQRSVEAMTDCQGQAESCIENARSAENSLDDILKNIESLNQLNHKVSEISISQAQLTSDVQTGVGNVYGTSENSADVVSQLSKSSEDLLDLSEQLKSSIGRFDL